MKAKTRKPTLSDARPPRHGWAAGAYFCKCSSCHKRFTGAKRAYMCADCAYENVVKR